MKGYYNKPEDTAEAIVAVRGKRAFRTGDRGRIDADGILTITGRIKEQYKLTNGKFVVPGNMENALMASRFVEQAFVYGRDQDHNVALLVPDFVALAAEIEGAPSDPVLLLRDFRQEVRAVLDRAVKAANGNADVRPYEAVGNYAAVPEAFTLDNGLLTPKMSMKRPVIQTKYQHLLDELYRTKEPSV